MRDHSVQKVVANGNVEIRVDTTVRMSHKSILNCQDIMIHNKKWKEIVLTKVGITTQDRLQAVETRNSGNTSASEQAKRSLRISNEDNPR